MPLVYTRKRISFARKIKKAVQDYYDISAELMDSRRRAAPLAHPRMLAMTLAIENTDLSYAQVGSVFANRDHTTVIHAENQTIKRMESDEYLMMDAMVIIDALKEARVQTLEAVEAPRQVERPRAITAAEAQFMQGACYA